MEKKSSIIKPIGGINVSLILISDNWWWLDPRQEGQKEP